MVVVAVVGAAEADEDEVAVANTGAALETIVGDVLFAGAAVDEMGVTGGREESGVAPAGGFRRGLTTTDGDVLAVGAARDDSALALRGD